MSCSLCSMLGPEPDLGELVIKTGVSLLPKAHIVDNKYARVESL